MNNFGLLVVQKFKEGLSPELQTAVCNMTSPPDNTSPEDWYNRLHAIESQRANHKLIARPSAPSHTSSQMVSRPAAKFVPPPVRSSPEPRSLFVPPASKPASSITPMDLDRTKTQQRPPAGACYLCGETGHVKRNCPRRIEVRHLDTDELEEELARRRDEYELLLHEGEVASSGEKSEEDFGTTSQ